MADADGSSRNPSFTEEQWRRLSAFGDAEDVPRGEYVFRTGDRDGALILVETGDVEVVRDPLRWSGETVLEHRGPGQLIGELGLLNGQARFLSARTAADSRIVRVPPDRLRRLLDEDDEIGDLVLHALWERREALRGGPAAMTLKLVGRGDSSEFLALRRYAERVDLVHAAVALPRDPTQEQAHGVAPGDLPVAYVQGEPIVRATPGEVAERLGLGYRADADEVVDLVVVGGGPAGLAAAIYGASEGLSTVLIDAVAPGGQAAATTRIENFLGFPFGVSGGRLIAQASLQALKFGVRLYAPCEAVGLDRRGDVFDVRLVDGRTVRSRTVVVTSGAAYKRLAIDRWEEFEHAGIYYAATPLEIRQVVDAPVVVVGGANSAGQAALALVASGCTVDLVVRGDDLGSRMSSYLTGRLHEEPRIRVRTGSNVTALHGDGGLEGVRIDSVGDVDAKGLFCFIGAEPATGWLQSLDRDRAGFVRTGTDVQDPAGERWRRLGREPMPFETSMPAVFAAGDVRRGSMKRVAAAVGEGSSAVASVHRALAEPR